MSDAAELMLAAVGWIQSATAFQMPRDWWSRALDVANLLLVPIGSALLWLAWDIWRKVIAMWTALFGRPEIRDDNGLVGRFDKSVKRLDRTDRDVGRLCEKNGLERSELEE